MAVKTSLVTTSSLQKEKKHHNISPFITPFTPPTSSLFSTSLSPPNIQYLPSKTISPLLEQMRKLHIASWISAYYCLWITAFALGLILLSPLSRPTHNHHTLSTAEPRASKQAMPPRGKALPALAYWISGTKGDSERILRLLRVTYHPRNQYLLQLDAGASERERAELALRVQAEEAEFRAFGNVDVVGKGYAMNEMGSSFLAAALHAAALLLKIGADWDWFVPLSASDYPLMTQDDILHSFTSLPRNLNFIHYNRTRWKERQIANRIVVDPSLYSEKSSPIMYAVETRENPDTFTVFGGSPWAILSRDLMEYCVQGWDNFPRKLLMYLSNMAYPIESYFHTILCHSQEFQNTTVDTDLRYMIWDSTIEDHQFLTMSHRDRLLATQGTAFAGPFGAHDPVLDEIDQRLLNLAPGECPSWGPNAIIDIAKPGLRGKNLQVLLARLVQEKGFGSFICSKNTSY